MCSTPTRVSFVVVVDVVVVTAARAYSKKHPPGRINRRRRRRNSHLPRALSPRLALTTAEGTTTPRPRRALEVQDGMEVLINICTGLVCLVIYSVYPPRLRGDARIIVGRVGILIGPRRAAPELF